MVKVNQKQPEMTQAQATATATVTPTPVKAKPAKQSKTVAPVVATPVVEVAPVAPVVPVAEQVKPTKTRATKTKSTEPAQPAVAETSTTATAPVPEQAPVQAIAVQAVAVEPEELQVTASGKPIRYFKLIYDGVVPKGRFSGTKPKQAASKALTSIINQRKSSGVETVGEFTFSILECTRNSKNKQYNYIGECVNITDDAFYHLMSLKS